MKKIIDITLVILLASFLIIIAGAGGIAVGYKIYLSIEFESELMNFIGAGVAFYIPLSMSIAIIKVVIESLPFDKRKV